MYVYIYIYIYMCIYIYIYTYTYIYIYIYIYISSRRRPGRLRSGQGPVACAACGDDYSKRGGSDNLQHVELNN